ncbi:homoserine dehydrogenase [Mangrovitalea sediminis]|uniref:homoserine dehydrogenase n=1 Tax=Mangrovitalea sediminis TaxID=1982043 RepID=UPI000BE52F01|nr:homoserine dehydrogenase [Mangrovitalea sediminis]
MKRITIAIAGIGGVGRKVAELLFMRQGRYARDYGVNLCLVAACGSRTGKACADGLAADDLDQLIPGLCGPDFLLGENPDILIEAGPTDIRTGQPGLDYIQRALKQGVHTIVISKGALVVSGNEIRESAAYSGAILKVSGATAAALPAIDLLEYSLMGCEIHSIEGILNATTNYLLSAMSERSLSLDEALQEAQQLGMAESDPRKDIEGWDTAAKLLILANFGLGASLSLDDFVVEGIQHITVQTITELRAGGKVPKLIGRVTQKGGVFRASVGIEPIPADDVFALVTGHDKALRVRTDKMGEIISIARSSEPTATAAAALKDLELILREIS